MKKRGKENQEKKKKKLRLRLALYLFCFLLVINLVLGGLNLAKAQGLFIPAQPKPLVVNGVIDLDDLTLKQKIAQMVVVLGLDYYAAVLKKMQLGGLHLHSRGSEEVFRETIAHFQQDQEIPFLITVDLEGCVNPFANYKEFKAASEVRSLGEAFEKGKAEGQYLHSLGFTLDFSPVVDLEDEIWQCRSFLGGAERVSELANAYMLGLQDEGILATAKHYPGKTLVIKDPHKYLTAAEITEEDIYPYKSLIEKGTVKAIMVNHLITFGQVNSEGKPSVASQKIVHGLRQTLGFKGLILTDEINMLGLKKFYNTPEEMYLDVFKGGADLILNFNQDPHEIYHMLEVIEQAVLQGEIPKERIDESVKRILEFKGFKVKS